MTQKALNAATVSLAVFPLITTTTDSTGAFTLTGTATGVKNFLKPSFLQPPALKNKGLCFTIGSDKVPVKVELFGIAGKKVATLLSNNLNVGNYFINLSHLKLSDQFYCIRLKIGTQNYLLKYAQVNSHIISSEFNNKTSVSFNKLGAFEKRKTIDDTLIVSEANHKTIRLPVSSYTSSVNTSILANRLQGLAHVTAVSPRGINVGLTKKTTTPFVMPTWNSGFINSNSPDYLQVTLKQITLRNTDSIVPAGSQQLMVAAWVGSKTLKLTGAGTVDIGDVVLDSFPTWKVTQIELSFSDSAQIKGSLTANFNMDTTYTQFLTQSKTFYTKAAYAYNAATNTGGADLSVGRYAAFETAPAESMFISLQGSSNGIATVTTPSSYTYDTAGALPSLTLVFDLSRMLRFYNGCNVSHSGGVNPPDPATKAYFFCHSVFYASVAAFFGTPGQIQGYESIYNCATGNCGVLGWMTIVCNAAGKIMSGIVMGNDDNDLTIAKGNISTVSETSPFDMHYNLSNVDLLGFSKGTAVGDSSIVSYIQFKDNKDTLRTGQAKFTLRFKTN